MVAIQILNLIGLVQIPKYSWVQSFIVDKEQGKYTWYMLVDLDNDIFNIVQNGIEVDFFDTTECVPGTTESLAGKHKFKISFYLKSDGKAVLWLNGSKTANMRYPTSYFKLHVDHMMNPICEAKDMRTQVNDKAASIQTCCIHNSPLFMASCAPVEVLHMDLNIFIKLCEHLNVNCRQLTLDHKLDGSTFCKKTELVPEWSTCPASSPARKFIQVFESAGQTGLANYYVQTAVH